MKKTPLVLIVALDNNGPYDDPNGWFSLFIIYLDIKLGLFSLTILTYTHLSCFSNCYKIKQKFML